MLAKDFPYCLCLNEPSMTVITINRVQEIYSTPVYETNAEAADLESLNKYLDSNTDINLDYYRLNQFNSVHIGNFVTDQSVQLRESLVAVVMPVFNQRVHFFRDAVESILRQSYTHIRLVIVDDGSTDAKLLQLMENYQKDDRVTLLKNDQNRGVAFSLNAGIQFAKEIPKVQFIARMDSDDICFKDRLL